MLACVQGLSALAVAASVPLLAGCAHLDELTCGPIAAKRSKHRSPVMVSRLPARSAVRNASRPQHRSAVHAQRDAPKEGWMSSTGAPRAMRRTPKRDGCPSTSAVHAQCDAP
jgi:hypothetical protein